MPVKRETKIGEENETAFMSANKKKTKRIALGALGFALSGAGLIYVFHDIEIKGLLDSAHRIKIVPLISSIALYWALLIVIRSFFIRHILRPVGKVSWTRVYRYICIGFLANNILPFRMGELVRIGGIARSARLDFAKVTGGIAIERILDLGMAAIVGIIAFQLAPVPRALQVTVLVTGVGLAVGFAVLIFIARSGLEERDNNSRGNSMLSLVRNLVARFASGLGSLRSMTSLAANIGFALGIWLTTIGVMLFRLAAFGLPPSLPIVIVLIAGITLGVALPSAPAFVGVYHAFVVGALVLFGVPDEVALGYAIFSHLTDIVPASLLGAAAMILEGLGFADIKRGATPNGVNR